MSNQISRFTLHLFTFFIAFIVYLPTGFAQSYTQFGLPPGAKSRIGNGAIADMQYSPDGTILAVASTIGIWLYDVETYQKLALLTTHEFRFSDRDRYRISFSSDGKTLAEMTDSSTHLLWDVSARTFLNTPVYSHNSIYPGPDMRRLAEVNGRFIFLKDIKDINTSKAGAKYLSGHEDDVTSVAFSLDGQTLASGSTDKTLRLWDVSTGALQRTLTAHEGTVTNVFFSPDGGLLISEGADKTFCLWDARTGDHQETILRDAFSGYRTTISPDGQLLASHKGQRTTAIDLSDVDTGKHKKTLKWQVFNTNKASEFGTDGKTFVFITQGHMIEVWNVATGEQQNTLSGHTADVISVAFRFDGQILASGSKDRTIRLWQPHSGKHLKTLVGPDTDVTSLVFSADGQMLASGGADKTIRLWDVGTGKQLKMLTKHDSAVTSVSFSADGKTLVSGDRAGSIYLWGVATGIHQGTFIGHVEPVTRVLLSPDGRTLAAQTRYDSIRMWDVATGTLQRTLAGRGPLWCMWFTPGGVLLAGSAEYYHRYDREIRLWDVSKGQQKAMLIGHTGWMSHLSVSLDGQTLASASWSDGTAILWDLTYINRAADSIR